MDKEVEPKAYAIPMDVDSSQMEAVIMSGEGKSFILHGPPGTGKSQTITNMIANALYQGKRVLFVAEKMAALSVVEKRLTKVGLEPFCLELHSNKVTKSHFLSQMEKALNAIHIARSEDYEKTSAALFEHRKKLIANMEALHRKHENGFSLYDCISGYVALKGGELYRTLPPLELVNPDKLEAWGAAIETLDTVFQITGHPADHPLCGLEPKDARKESLDKVESLLRPYAEAVNGFMSQSADGDQRKDYLHALETCAALDAYNDARDTLLSKSRKRQIVQARQIAMYLSRNLIDNCSLATIGAELGGKDHATVLHACTTVSDLMSTDKSFKQYITDISKMLVPVDK